MSTDSGQRDDDYPRVCDICGHRFWDSELTDIGEAKKACKDDAPGLTALQISRYNARVKPVVVRPRKFAKDYIQTPIYQLAEAQLFNFIAEVSPANVRDGSDSPLAAAWAAVYMADVVIQDKRPLVWNRTALETISRCLTYLLTRQCGSGLLASTAITDTRYGGITDGDADGSEFSTATWSTAMTIVAGAAFLKGYQATGSVAYLEAAKKCATFLRHVQCGDKQVSGYHVYPIGGGRYHSGGLASGVTDSTGALLTTYLTGDIGGLWFIKLLADRIGASTSFGDASTTAYMAQATAATLTTMISELMSFGQIGPRDASNEGEFTPGLSTTAPRLTYQTAVNGGSSGGSWHSLSDVESDDICFAILGLYTAGGLTAKVQEMMAWLASFSSNESNRTQAGIPESVVLEGITGTYDPAVAPATSLVAAAPFTESADALYSWASEGLLAPILSSTSPSAFRDSKNAVSQSRRESFYSVENKWLGPIGMSGLTYQPRAYASMSSGGSSSLLAGITPGGSVGSPTSAGMQYWFEASDGVTLNGLSQATAWADQGDHGRNVTANNIPWIASGINGLPSLNCDGHQCEYTGANLFAQGEPRTVISVVRPALIGDIGGYLHCFRRGGGGGRVFGCGLWTFLGPPNPQYLYTNGVDVPDNIRRIPPVNYAGQDLLIIHAFDGTRMSITVNGIELPVDQDQPGLEDATSTGFVLLRLAGVPSTSWRGLVSLMLCYDTPAPPSGALIYAARRYGFATDTLSGSPNVIGAAKTGAMYRYDPGVYPLHRGN